MKKQLLIFAVQISIFSFAQTKEEAIAEVKDKLEKYGKDYVGNLSLFKNVFVSPCKVVIEFEKATYEFDPSESDWVVNFVGCKATKGAIIKANDKYWHYIPISDRGAPDNIMSSTANALNYLETFCEKTPTN